MSYAYADESRTRAIRLTGRVRLTDGERVESWNQIAYEGEWRGHPSGEFKFTRADFEAIIANFRRREQGIPATFGHPRDSVQAALAGQAGRVVDLRIGEDPKGRGASLEALIRFTPRAAEMVRAGELEHCSVVVGFESVDEVTGEEIGPELYELGLVVQPFLADMRPLQLSASSRGKVSLSMDPQAIRAKLAEVAAALNISTEDLEEDDAFSRVWDAVNALMQANKLAQILGGPTAAPEMAASLDKIGKRISLALDIDKLKAALDELPTDVTPEQARKVFEAALMMEDALAGEGKSDKPKDAAKDVAASADAPPVAPPVAAAEPPMGDAEMMAQQAVDFVTAAGEALGTDAAGALAAMQENLDAILSLLSGGADGGTSADDVAAMSKNVLAMSKRIKELEADLEARRKSEAEAKESARLAACEARIDAAIGDGRLAKEARDAMVRLARRGDDVLDDALSAHTAAMPKVPEGRRYEASGRKQVAASKSPEDAKRVELERLTPAQSYAYKSLMAVKGMTHERALADVLKAQ